ncbi:NAD-dependent epimerase/dehydratase family protein [Jiangella muralis]|uniref:NAD-dependent epimerase/dehydratase family protein n=1 Tax=Jiangella muralis TaxID=702383 RepID=UPI00069ECBEF|nr:NAD-dependent epimerase/dehydratase family protein [Jiangella muralis]
MSRGRVVLIGVGRRLSDAIGAGLPGAAERHGDLTVVLGTRDDGAAEDRIERMGRQTWSELVRLRPRRVILLSSLRVFDGYEPGWRITENWRPRPTTDPDSLAPYVAELAVVETARSLDIDVVILRLADDGADESGGDVAARILDRVRAPLASYPRAALTVEHLGSPSPRGGAPRRERHEEAWDPREILVTGAGGPLGAAAFDALASAGRVTLTDAASLADCAARAPQSPGAPLLPDRIPDPHRFRTVDLTDPAAVLAAMTGIDCVVNCAVVRDGAPAFAVNLRGAYLVLRSAVRLGIRRVVHTGPAQVIEPYPDGYLDDAAVDESAPARPGANAYLLSKYLAQEVTRVFAEQHGLDCPMLLFCGLVSPRAVYHSEVHPFAVTWADAGRAVSAAVRRSPLREAAPIVHIGAPSPHGRYRFDRADEVIGFRAQDALDHYWRN